MSNASFRTISKKEKFESVFVEHFPRVYNYVYYHVGNIEDAEDLTADIFVKAYKYWDGFSEEKGSYGAWIGGIARNTITSYYQKKPNKPSVIELSDSMCSNTDIENSYMQKAELERVFEHIAALPKRQQEILTMKFFLGLTNKEISDVLCISANSVGVTLYRIIKEIKKKM